MNLDYIIPSVDPALIRQELTQETFVKKTRKAGNEIHIFNHKNAPNALKEVGRLREISFALGGGGTGKPIDIDKYDTSENCYDQLIVYSPEDEQIIGGYRFMVCSKIKNPKENIPLSVNDYFHLSEKFIDEYLPFTIELGRSWIQPQFQSSNPRKGIFALDNLWDGLGALSSLFPHFKYFLGKVTMYPSYNLEGRDALLYFMDYYFPDKDALVTPRNPLEPTENIEDFKSSIENLSFKEGHNQLHLYLKARGERIPPLINSYMNLSPTMRTFGTMINYDFGNVLETGIMITVQDIYPDKMSRYLV